MTESLAEKVHSWEGLIQYIFDEEDLINNLELGKTGAYNITRKLEVNQFFTVSTISVEQFGTGFFEDYLNNLKSLGLDIGKGNCEFGYKMPLPEKGEDKRKLIIFKRK